MDLHYRLKQFASIGFALICAGALSSCSSTAYFWQAAKGHLTILAESRDIQSVINDPDTKPEIKHQLEFAQRIRAFSVETLKLPDNHSYRRYADIHRRYVVWNVVAAPKDSLVLKKWCFPFTGCVSYKGFYDEKMAQAQAQTLRDEGLDVAVMGVPAYSTLGFTPDPVLSTFIRYPAGELARMIFHELAHQTVYIKDDSTFNESFATAVEELGVVAWLDLVGNEDVADQYQRFDVRRRMFQTLISKARADLKTIYENPDLSEAQKLDRKKERLLMLKRDYARIKAGKWGGWSGYDFYFSQDLNNAKLAVSGLYNQDVPAFKTLFARCGTDFARFYHAVATLGAFDKPLRDEMLAKLANREPLKFSLGCDQSMYPPIDDLPEGSQSSLK